MLVKHRSVAICSACGEEAECTQQDNYPDNGWVLPFDLFGYYGGFDDNMAVLVGQRQSREWIMCHDCVVKFLDLFPRLSESLGGSSHPCSKNEEPCCKYAWRIGYDANGDSVTETSWPDKKWKIVINQSPSEETEEPF